MDKEYFYQIMNEDRKSSGNNTGISMAEYAELCAESDPGFFRWALGDGGVNDFGDNMTEAQKAEYQSLIDYCEEQEKVNISGVEYTFEKALGLLEGGVAAMGGDAMEITPELAVDIMDEIREYGCEMWLPERADDNDYEQWAHWLDGEPANFDAIYVIKTDYAGEHVFALFNDIN